jgi:hypothetical protein
VFRYTAAFDFQVSDEDVLIDQLTALRDRTGEDLLPALARTIQRMQRGQGTLYLTRDLQGTAYWTDEQPIGWVEGLVVAKWVLLADHGGEVEVR